MNKFLKISSIAVIVTVLCFMLYGVIKAFFGNYFEYNPFNAILIGIAYIIFVYFAIKGIKQIWILPLFLMLFTMIGCNYAKSNQQVLVSSDCGMSWNKINAGEAVPKSGINACYMKVVIPNYPMQGESKFISNLKGTVRASVHIDYDYSIIDPLSFIKQAKYLGKANSNADSNDALDNNAFEGAENMVIDKRIKDEAKEIFLNEDIVELNQAEIETH